MYIKHNFSVPVISNIKSTTFQIISILWLPKYEVIKKFSNSRRRNHQRQEKVILFLYFNIYRCIHKSNTGKKDASCACRYGSKAWVTSSSLLKWQPHRSDLSVRTGKSQLETTVESVRHEAAVGIQSMLLQPLQPGLLVHYPAAEGLPHAAFLVLFLDGFFNWRSSEV
jgi:hypothetical protein